MIACDTSCLVAYLQGEEAPDTDRLDAALDSGAVGWPPVVVTEILSGVTNDSGLKAFLAKVALLQTTKGYWARAGQSRSMLKRHGLKAKVADALIAQSCIDHDLPLLTRDADFRHFAKHCGLRLA